MMAPRRKEWEASRWARKWIYVKEASTDAYVTPKALRWPVKISTQMQKICQAGWVFERLGKELGTEEGC